MEPLLADHPPSHQPHHPIQCDYRQFFRSIPRDLDDAAKVDGANYLKIFSRIILPLSPPALASVAIFSFIYHWSDCLGPLIYLNDNDLYPASLGLAQYTATYGGTQWDYLMAASLVLLLPCVIVFHWTALICPGHYPFRN